MKRNRKIGTLSISPEIMREIDALAPRTTGGSSLDWTREMDEAVLYGWNGHRQSAFAAWFKCRFGSGSISSIKARFDRLQSAQNTASASSLTSARERVKR